MAGRELSLIERVAIELEAMLISGDLPPEQRRKVKRVLSEMKQLTPEERAAKMDEFMKQVGFRYDEFRDGVSQRRRVGRPPKGALPAVDDTPWAPPRRRGKRDR